jgi:hypothetical protein
MIAPLYRDGAGLNKAIILAIWLFHWGEKRLSVLSPVIATCRNSAFCGLFIFPLRIDTPNDQT